MCATPFKRHTRTSSTESSVNTRSSQRSKTGFKVPLQIENKARRSKRATANSDSIPVDQQTLDLQPDAVKEGRLLLATSELEPADSSSDIERGRPEKLEPLILAVLPPGDSMRFAFGTPVPTSVLAHQVKAPNSEPANPDHHLIAHKVLVPTSNIVDEGAQEIPPTVRFDVCL